MNWKKCLKGLCDFNEEVKSMEVNNQTVEEAKVGDMIGLKVKERVRENDQVFKVVEADRNFVT